MADPKAPHPRPFYTPIAEIAGRYVAEPVYCGLKFAQQFADSRTLKLDFDPGPVNATAYAAKSPTEQILVAIINKDKSRDLSINLPGFSLSSVMTAPSLTSTEIDFSELSTYREGSSVPRASAAIFRSIRS